MDNLHARVTRNYNFSDIVMLTSMATIAQNALTHENLLISFKPAWAAPFFTNFKNDLDGVIQTYMGMNNGEELVAAADAFTKIQCEAIERLSDFKVQLQQDFRKQPLKRQEILEHLGFITHYRQASANDSQESLVALLYQFRAGIDELKDALIAKGIDATLIDQICEFADYLQKAKVSVAIFKSSRTGIPPEAVKEFNRIYDKGIAMAITAAHFVRKETELKQGFSFTRLAKIRRAGLKIKTVLTEKPLEITYLQTSRPIAI